jgi:hypothetical protein
MPRIICSLVYKVDTMSNEDKGQIRNMGMAWIHYVPLWPFVQG